PERLPHRLLCREPTRVVLGRVRLRVAVLPFRLGEAAGPEAVSVALERAPYPLDLDQVDADPRRRGGHRFSSSQSGSWAMDETMPSGATLVWSSSSGRNLPVRTSTVRIPTACPPTTSPSRSSPTIHVMSGSASSASIAAPKYAGLGFPSTVASIPAAYSRPATIAPASRRGPSAVCHQRLRCRQYSSAPASSSRKARFKFRYE